MPRLKKSAEPRTLAELRAKQQQLQAELEALNAQREAIEEQEIEAMVEVVGRAYVTQARKDDAQWQQLVRDMDVMLRKKADRALFGLPPLPRKPRTKKS